MTYPARYLNDRIIAEIIEETSKGRQRFDVSPVGTIYPTVMPGKIIAHISGLVRQQIVIDCDTSNFKAQA